MPIRLGVIYMNHYLEARRRFVLLDENIVSTVFMKDSQWQLVRAHTSSFYQFRLFGCIGYCMKLNMVSEPKVSSSSPGFRNLS
jgi:hypothetical protein